MWGWLGLCAAVGFSFQAFAGDLNFQDLRDHLINKKIGTIEEALPELVQKYPDYFTFNTLMYGSLSAQEANLLEPRVIVFGPKAQFVMAFNGGSHLRGGMAFETMEFSNHEFIFREIFFKYPGYDPKDTHLQPDEVAFENEQLIVSKDNPKMCLNCHGQVHPGPNWAPYFLWQGAYGSDDDMLHTSFDRGAWNANNQVFFESVTSPQSQGRGMLFKSGYKDTELEGMVNYVEARPNHARYKWLPEAFIEQGIRAYKAGTPFDQLDYTEKAKQERARLNVGYEWPSRPNLFFQVKLMELNQDRIIWDLAGLKDAFQSPWWSEFTQFIFEKLDSNSPTLLTDLAAEMNRGLTTFTLKGSVPTVEQVEELLTKMITLDVKDQIGRAALHDKFLGEGSIQYFGYPGNNDPARYGMEWIGKPLDFFSKLLGITAPAETDLIGFYMETDSIAELTMVKILLADQGIDLHPYNMNLGRRSGAFHSGGMEKVIKFLGVRYY